MTKLITYTRFGRFHLGEGGGFIARIRGKYFFPILHGGSNSSVNFSRIYCLERIYSYDSYIVATGTYEAGKFRFKHWELLSRFRCTSSSIGTAIHYATIRR